MGLYDMLGNVFEWCQDGRREYTEVVEVDPVVEPLGADAVRVFRGGSWCVSALIVRAAVRDWVHPGDAHVYLGFRCSSSGA